MTRIRENMPFYLEAVLSTYNDAVTIINKDSEVLYWNEAAEQTYHIRKEKIIGEIITKFFKIDDLMILKVLKSGIPVQNVYHRPREDKHVFVNSSPVYDSEKRLIGAVSIEQDISHTVRLNEKLTDTSSRLEELKQKFDRGQRETPFSKLKGKSVLMQRTMQMSLKAAKTNATVLILGESGTGKELCAHAIHEASERNEKPFVPINCGAIPHALFESELFGYVRGAFTGASNEGKVGKIEAANGGTLFLDEIGELPLDMQVKLLRVLQENVVYPIGSSKGKKVDVRVIAATNRNLNEMMENEKFRSDLFYRLNVIQITIPPLRKRLNDIPELANQFLNDLDAEYQTPPHFFNENALQMLAGYDWPGNVRELRNIVERAVILSETSEITEKELHSLFPARKTQSNRNDSLSDEKRLLEKDRILETLDKENGNKSAAARKLGISRVSLYKKLKKYESGQ